jgi:aminodeoxychorismate synthase component I
MAMTSRGYSPFHLLEKLDLRLPFWRYYELHRGRPYSFLLDSARDPRKHGRFSFMGSDPFLTLKAKRLPRKPGQPRATRIELVDRPGASDPSARSVVTEITGDPFEEIRQLLSVHYVDRDAYSGRPTPFLAGAVGYFGYEAGHFIEDIPDLGEDDLGLPDIYLMFVSSTMVHCHRTGASYLSVLGRGPNDVLARVRAERTRDTMLARIEKFEANPPPEWMGPTSAQASAAKLDLHAMFDERAYCKMVDDAKEHIFAGDIFEICLTHRLDAAFQSDPWKLYQELRRVNPAPFAGYLNLPEAQVLSSSPERFLRLGADHIAESRPIKGTRPRGKTEAEDQRLHDELQNAEKDQAENNMIVDLVRNDFGRVCTFGSVNVPELRVIERYATVYQMVSTIRGQLEDERDGVDLVRACFPGGSMTGAPKVEAMKLIDRFEPVKRGIYSGSIGYFDFSGVLDFNIVIRTMVLKNQRSYFNVGGAIIADSEPRAEYQETMDKARALVTALKNTIASDRT